MLRRIDLFMPPNVSQYGVLHHFTKKFHQALQRLGVTSRILHAQYNDPKPFLSELFQDVPDCTLSFNGLLPDDEGRFFADMIKIPHVACIVDSPNDFVSLAQSPYTIISSVDKDACEFFRGVNCQNVVFMPHGIEKSLTTLPSEEDKNFEVVMLASCIDYEALEKEWGKKYPLPLVLALEEAADLSLNHDIPYVKAFVQAFEKQASSLDPSKINFIELLTNLEFFIRGKGRVELIKAIKDAPIDIFGAPSPSISWKKQLGKQSNLRFHDPVPFDQALEIMRSSKIVLNSCAWIKNGIHERTLAGLACGALVVTEENNFLLENKFVNDSNIVFYRYPELETLNDRISHYLQDDNDRIKIAEAGKLQSAYHTWDQRAASLLKQLDPIIKTFRG